MYQNTELKNEANLQPQFDVYHRVENHTIQLGATAFLPCIIKNLGNRSVGIIYIQYLKDVIIPFNQTYVQLIKYV